jgi:hypothetical protein
MPFLHAGPPLNLRQGNIIEEGIGQSTVKIQWDPRLGADDTDRYSVLVSTPSNPSLMNFLTFATQFNLNITHNIVHTVTVTIDLPCGQPAEQNFTIGMHCCDHHYG